MIMEKMRDGIPGVSPLDDMVAVRSSTLIVVALINRCVKPHGLFFLSAGSTWLQLLAAWSMQLHGLELLCLQLVIRIQTEHFCGPERIGFRAMLLALSRGFLWRHYKSLQNESYNN